MPDEEFEILVERGIAQIPKRFLSKLDNVAIVIADNPTTEQLRENHVEDGGTLLGLYEGIPLTERGEYYGIGGVLPDKITIFKNPTLLEATRAGERVEDVVRDTVWHEIAHFFGYDDAEIEGREDAGTNYST
jgi:predicted Zn-dependent protease with MMP-like domain